MLLDSFLVVFSFWAAPVLLRPRGGLRTRTPESALLFVRVFEVC